MRYLLTFVAILFCGVLFAQETAKLPADKSLPIDETGLPGGCTAALRRLREALAAGAHRMGETGCARSGGSRLFGRFHHARLGE
jgi:hypothetical protein